MVLHLNPVYIWICLEGELKNLGGFEATLLVGISVDILFDSTRSIEILSSETNKIH